MSLLDRVKESAVEHQVGAKCATCRMLAAMSPDDLAEYHEAVELIGQRVDGSLVSASDVGRALGMQPGTYRQHVQSGHREPR